MTSVAAARGKRLPLSRRKRAKGRSVCALCGVFGGKGHWSDSTSAPDVFASRTEPQTRLRERQTRTRLINVILKHYGVTVKDWSGSSYLLTTLTGRTAIVDTVGELWAAAERLSGRTVDPLDDAYLATLEKLPPFKAAT
jgi:hypothetical protein